MHSILDSSIARMDAMNASINPARLKDEQVLSYINANLELLYVKAKNYHWNVTGVGFKGVHEIFDDLHEYCEEQADRVAERMRYFDMKVDARMSSYLSKALFPEGDSTASQSSMLLDASNSLQALHDYLIMNMDGISCPVTQNMTQDICEGLDKFNYFIKSSMYVYPSNLE